MKIKDVATPKNKAKIVSLDKGFNKAFEIAFTPLVVGGLGFLLDRWLGTMPIFTIAFVLFTCVAMFIKLWYEYKADMDVATAHTVSIIHERRDAQAVLDQKKANELLDLETSQFSPILDTQAFIDDQLLNNELAS